MRENEMESRNGEEEKGAVLISNRINNSNQFSCSIRFDSCALIKSCRNKPIWLSHFHQYSIAQMCVFLSILHVQHLTIASYTCVHAMCCWVWVWLCMGMCVNMCVCALTLHSICIRMSFPPNVNVCMFTKFMAKCKTTYERCSQSRNIFGRLHSWVFSNHVILC